MFMITVSRRGGGAEGRGGGCCQHILSLYIHTVRLRYIIRRIHVICRGTIQYNNKHGKVIRTLFQQSM